MGTAERPASVVLQSTHEIARRPGDGGVLPLSHAVVLPTVSIGQVLKAWRLQPGEFPALVTALRTGQLTVAAGTMATEKFGEIRLLVSSVRAWRANQQAEYRERLSIDAASRVLQIKQQVGYQLARAGLLVTVEDNAGRRNLLVFREAIVDFAARYVSLAELARGRRCAPRVLMQALPQRPVCGPLIDGIRQYFYLRADLVDQQSSS